MEIGKNSEPGTKGSRTWGPTGNQRYMEFYTF